MAFDGIVTKSIVTELKPFIIGAKVNKIFEPTKNEIVLGLYSLGKSYALKLSSNPNSCRIHLTTHSKPNPLNAPNFCMLLRKYLIGAKIKSISTLDLDRIVEIVLEGYNEMNDVITRKLFIEIMNRQSNIIFTNENNIIIDTLKHIENTSRDLLPAHPYTYPTSSKKSFLELNNYSEFQALFENVTQTYQNQDIPETITKDKPNSIKEAQHAITSILSNEFIGFSKALVDYSLHILKIDNTSYTENDLKKLYEYLKSITQFDTAKLSLTKINENDYTLELTNNNDLLHLNFFIDDFYYDKEEKEEFKNAKSNLSRVILTSLKKCSKKIENINSKLKECESMNTYRLYGELITANLYKYTENTDSMAVINYYDNTEIIIPLDKSISPHKNADKYFKKYNKLKNSLEIVSKQKTEAEKELQYIESLVYSLESSKTVMDLEEIYDEITQNLVTLKEVQKSSQKQKTQKSKKKSNEITISKLELDGYTIFIGKNNVQNDYLTLKYAHNNDIWFHTQKIHGSHVVLKLNNQDLTDDIIYKCAKIAVQNSKANNSINVPVDYTEIRNVKKAPNAKPGMVIYTNYKTIIVK